MASEPTDAEWPIVPISEVVFFQEGPGLRNWQYRDAGIPFVNIRCLKDGRLLRGEMNHLDPTEVAEKYAHFLLDAGDYVVSSSGTLGRVAEVFDTDLPCMLNTSVIRFRPIDASRLDRRFLKAFLRSELFNEQILAFANGSAQLNYGPTHLKQMTMPLPPIDEQRMVGDVMSALDNRIDNLRATNATLEAIAQALFKSWFVDFDPVHAKGEGRAPAGMDGATAALFPSEFEASELGPIPKGWRADEVGTISRNIREQAKPDEIDPATPYIGLEHMPRGSIALTERGVSDGLASNKFWYRRNDILFGKLRPYFHKVGVAAKRGVCSTDILVVRPLAELWFGYVAMQFSSDDVIAYATRLSNGAKMPRTNWHDLAKYPVVLPSPEVANAFDSAVRALVARIHANIALAETFGALRDTLLPRLISGKLRLPETGAATIGEMA